jgi:hypothetical protein
MDHVRSLVKLRTALSLALGWTVFIPHTAHAGCEGKIFAPSGGAAWSGQIDTRNNIREPLSQGEERWFELDINGLRFRVIPSKPSSDMPYPHLYVAVDTSGPKIFDAQISYLPAKPITYSTFSGSLPDGGAADITCTGYIGQN